MTIDNEMREALAEYAHDSWSGWMKYLAEKTTFNADGTATIPAWAVTRWNRQMHTPYADLPEPEKESDRVEADKIIAITQDADSEWGDAHLLALRNQMADAGLVVQTVAEGVTFLLKLFEVQGEIKRVSANACEAK